MKKMIVVQIQPAQLPNSIAFNGGTTDENGNSSAFQAHPKLLEAHEHRLLKMRRQKAMIAVRKRVLYTDIKTTRRHP